MPNPPSGFRTGSSNRLPRKIRRRRRHLQQMKSLATQMKKVKVLSKPPKITWTQIRTLVKQAKQLILTQNNPLTPTMYFVAFLSLISTPKVESAAYWSYIPNPPLLHPVGWLDQDPVKILTNDSLRLGGLQDSESRSHAVTLINFTGRADSIPICFTLRGKAPPFCLPTSYKVFLTDAPDPNDAEKRYVWEYELQTIGTFNYNETCLAVNWLPIPNYKEKYKDKNQFWESSLTKTPT
ncbi:endogenous retrovirus group K member 19 Env polyprotein-like [Nycticebus coucang]|uniref:endogenous retrovirus group K member 19 Env polyprotein-like n=1 Tax=Nycticebus coucang TaxID=9470 RepID=UPI00234CF8E7|nr:endogenous retrovirus group K member 19 Env polyprotein-like [Nycticebus coucang]